MVLGLIWLLDVKFLLNPFLSPSSFAGTSQGATEPHKDRPLALATLFHFIFLILAQSTEVTTCPP